MKPLFFTAPDFSPPSNNGIMHYFGTRQMPVLSSPVAKENLQQIAQNIGQKDFPIITAHQKHSAKTIYVERAFGKNPPAGDALVTDKAGLFLAILTADCAPVLLGDGQAGIIGAAHAGWRGAVDGILESVISALCELGAGLARIKAVIGPMIHRKNYAVSEEWRQDILARDQRAEDFFCPCSHDSCIYFDLPGYIRQRLTRRGVENISTIAYCTYEREDYFFSFRRATHLGETGYGRQISLIGRLDGRKNS